MIRHFRVRRGTGSLRYRSECGRFECYEKLPFLCVNKSPIRYGFRVGAKAAGGGGGGGATSL